jgi:ATP-binding cassette subfamily F protein 3
MLDEPTNHLDMQSVEMLIDALNKYEGTFILVSHDRYFISKTANKIWVIEDGLIREFNGSYDEWVIYEQEKEKRKAAQGKSAPAPVVEKKVEAPKQQSQQISSELKQLQKEHQKKQRDFQKLEEQINKLNEEKAKIEQQLADPEFYSDKDKFRQVDDAYQKLNIELNRLSVTYDKLFEEILELEKKIN